MRMGLMGMIVDKLRKLFLQLCLERLLDEAPSTVRASIWTIKRLKCSSVISRSNVRMASPNCLYVLSQPPLIFKTTVHSHLFADFLVPAALTEAPLLRGSSTAINC